MTIVITMRMWLCPVVQLFMVSDQLLIRCTRVCVWPTPLTFAHCYQQVQACHGQLITGPSCRDIIEWF